MKYSKIFLDGVDENVFGKNKGVMLRKISKKEKQF
jgi:hypothetical protein